MMADIRKLTSEELISVSGGGGSSPPPAPKPMPPSTQCWSTRNGSLACISEDTKGISIN